MTNEAQTCIHSLYNHRLDWQAPCHSQLDWESMSGVVDSREGGNDTRESVSDIRGKLQ